jgi:hypothetical protein
MSRVTKPLNIMQFIEPLDADALPPPHRLVLLVLAGVQGLSFPTEALLAKRTGMSPQAVKAVLADLRSARWFCANDDPIVHLRAGLPVPKRKTVNADVAQSEFAERAMSGPTVRAPSDVQSTPIPPTDSRWGTQRRHDVGANPPLNTPSRAPLTMAGLLQQRPGDDLLAVLSRGAEEGNRWCQATAEYVLENGGAITPDQRKRLRQIRDQPRRDRGTSSLQPAGNWRPKGTLA